jgi:hypothetical protein
VTIICSDIPFGTVCTTRPPGPGRSHYLPDSVYFDDPWDDQGIIRASRSTVRCLARLGTRYEAWEVGDLSAVRRGTLPREVEGRDRLIFELHGWLEEKAAPWHLIGFRLWRRSVEILDQHDGPPGILTLTPDEFAALQEWWLREGLPADLYYPAEQQRMGYEQILADGHLVWVERRYSPLRWARRDPSVTLEALARVDGLPPPCAPGH